MIDLRPVAEDILRPHAFDYEIEGHNSLKVEAYDEPFFVGRFGIQCFPANPFYAVFWGVKVHEDFRGLGIGQELLRLRLNIAQEAGIHTCMATVRNDNGPQSHIMQKYGFEPERDPDDGPTTLWVKPLTDNTTIPEPQTTV